MSSYKDELDKMVWSFSRIKSFEQCRYEFYLHYIEGRTGDQNFYADFGSLCHKILEKILKGKTNRASAVMEFEKKFPKFVDKYDLNDKMASQYYDAGDRYFQSLDFSWLDAFDVLGVEKKCNFKIDGKPYVGYIDLLVREKETNNIYIIDHKSSAYPLTDSGKVMKTHQLSHESYVNQLCLYALWVKTKYNTYPVKIIWNYFRVGKWLELDFTTEMLDRAVKWAAERVGEIYQEETFPCSTDWFYCNRLCEYRESCEYKTEEDE